MPFEPGANITRDILSEVRCWHCPSVAELKFRGLMIEEGWDLHSKHIILPLTTTALLLIVVGARLLYGDWGIAWNVGCFFVALVALSTTWADYATK